MVFIHHKPQAFHSCHRSWSHFWDEKWDNSLQDHRLVSSMYTQFLRFHVGSPWLAPIRLPIINPCCVATCCYTILYIQIGPLLAYDILSPWYVYRILQYSLLPHYIILCHTISYYIILYTVYDIPMCVFSVFPLVPCSCFMLAHVYQWGGTNFNFIACVFFLAG